MKKKYRQFKDFTFVLSQQIWQTSTTSVLIFCPSLGSDSVGQRDQHHTDRHTGVQWLVLPYRQRAPTDGTRRNPAGHLWLWKHNRRGTGTYRIYHNMSRGFHCLQITWLKLNTIKYYDSKFMIWLIESGCVILTRWRALMLNCANKKNN